MTAVVAGFALGLAGSLHCVAMCGPLVLAIRSPRTGRGAALYHGARIAMYAAAGALAGFAGAALAAASLGRALSMAAGAMLLVAAAHRAGLLPALPAAGSTRLPARAMGAVHRLGARHPVAGTIAAGAVNALLPCGLVYAAIAAAAAMGTPASAALFMVSFGAATVPALAAVCVMAGSMPAALRARARLAVPVALAAVGVLLVVRGVLDTTHRM